MYKLSPSKASRYLRCTKSLEYDVAFVDTPVTIRGKMLHLCAEKLLTKSADAETFIVENNLNPYEKWLVESYANAVNAESFENNSTSIKIENRMSINLFDFKINMVIDTLILSRDTASIIDLKTGNVTVEVIENEQLYFYALAVALKYSGIKKFRNSIFQKGKMKTNELTRAQVLDFFLSKEDTFEQIRNNKLTYNPSDEACKYCGNKDKCMARSEWIINGKK